ncbi:STAS-like domain-containing protein [Mesoflavibacter zeaxanthinifaciens]|uniref:STAS-like domain-containing protein n=1 Tax=Mesoflavibacter zeaxanthinifaciens TaxID=393060 RepID=UPI000416D879|nr:STAS-like domain-containing protein [Mesoflavibacter zeaxanthinifaciens]
MELINVLDIIDGNFAVTTDDGNTIYYIVDEHLTEKKEVVLDFMGITIVTTAFLNAAIGQLYNKFNSEQISPYLSLRNIDDEDLILFKKVTDRAKQYFAEKTNRS